MNPIYEKKQQIFSELINDPRLGRFCRREPEFPGYYCKNTNDVKAIVLGADPTNPQNLKFKKVFGLEKEYDSPYFRPILKNLSKVGLDLNNIYVQNLCPNYFLDVTDVNEFYIEIAQKYWLSVLKQELDSFFKSTIPVLVTAWKPLKVIVPGAEIYTNKKSQIYKDAVIFSDNEIDRPVLAFFRGGLRKGYNGYYDLAFADFSNYKELIKKLIA